MAQTIVSNLVVFSDASGHGNQGHLVYAATQQKWWAFVIKTKTATVVSAYVSSSNDLTTATWSASTDSPAFPTSHALSTNDQRNLSVAGFANGSTDVAHVSVGIGPLSTASGFTEHVRATFTGASSITWESWNEFTASNATQNWGAIKGNALGVSSSGNIHEAGMTTRAMEMDCEVRIATNADTTSTWTNGWSAGVGTDQSMTNQCNAYAFAALASNAMLMVYDNGGGTEPNSTGLRSQKYTSGAAWPNNTGSADVGIGSSSFDQNDWCLCRVDDTHLYAFRRAGVGQFNWRKHDGSTTWSTPTNGVPNQNHLAGSGMFAASDGTDLYLFVLDSTGNQAVAYIKCTGANATTPTWGSWTNLEAAGSTARNFISGCPVVGNNQIGVIFTAVNGSNFDLVVTALSLVTADTLMPQCWC